MVPEKSFERRRVGCGPKGITDMWLGELCTVETIAEGLGTRLARRTQ